MRRFAAALAPTAAQAWCWGSGTSGDGNNGTEARQVADFTAVRVMGSIDAAVKVGGERSVRVTIDQNLQPLATTEVSGGTLVVKVKDASWNEKGIVEITVPTLRAFTIDGSSDATIEGGEGELTLTIEGSGDLRWTGAATSLEASIAGSGDIRLTGSAEEARLSVAGSGDVVWHGRAMVEQASVSGSGEIVRR